MRMIAFAALLITLPVMADEADQPVSFSWTANLCEGDGCDAYLPVLKKTVRFEDISGRKKWGAVLGGLSGALIGEDVAGVPGAALLGTLGVAAGYDYIDSERWEADAKVYQQAWQRGDDIYYNPAHRLPLVAHWMYAGPVLPEGVRQKK